MINSPAMLSSTSIKKIFKSFTVYTSAKFINQAIPFLLLPVLTRFLSPRDYGVLATFLAMMGITNVVISLESTNAIVRGYFDREKESFNFPQYTFNAMIISFVAFLVVFSVIFFSKSFISQKFSIPANWLLLLPLIGICSVIFNIPIRIFVFKQRPLPYAVARISNTFLEVILSLFFVVFLGMNWQGRVLGVAINKIIFLAIGIFILFKSKLLQFSINYKYIKDILTYAVPIVFHSLSFTIVAATDRLFISRLIDFSATGLYSVGYSISAIIGFFSGALSLAWSPVLYEKLGSATQRVKAKLVKYTYLFFAVIMAAALVLIFTAPYFLKFFVGDKFYGADQFIFWIALGYAIHGLYVMIAGYIFYQKKTYLLSRLAVIIVLLNFVFNYVLIKLNGAIGAAQATFLTFLIRFIWVWYLSNKVYPMPWFSFYRKVTNV